MSDAPSLTAVLVALGRAVRARQGTMLQSHGLHPGQDALLLEVWREPGLNQATLALRLGIESPTVTRMVMRLERVGLLERRRDADDARCMRIHPTARSRLLEASVKTIWEEVGALVARGIGEDDADRLTALAVAATAALRHPDTAR
ncbi:MAG TPA: MarR family transcriptional regulator [Gemmatimonadales bacterium]|nr:MarR family transcriptional regulator [Gemmatimonadales bacterium]